MMNWFYNWLDPKILRLEQWINQQVVKPDKIDIDLDKVKKGEVRDNPMYRQPPDSGKYGPFLANLQGATTLDYVYGPGEMEIFAQLLYQPTKKHTPQIWWRHRDAGTTEDFHHEAFSDIKSFFVYAHGSEEKYWDCVLRTKALNTND